MGNKKNVVECILENQKVDSPNTFTREIDSISRRES